MCSCRGSVVIRIVQIQDKFCVIFPTFNYILVLEPVYCGVALRYSTDQRQGITQMCLSPEMNVFVSGNKHICLQRRMHLSPAMNPFAVTCKGVCPNTLAECVYCL